MGEMIFTVTLFAFLILMAASRYFYERGKTFKICGGKHE